MTWPDRGRLERRHVHISFLILLIILAVDAARPLICPKEFKHRCLCGMEKYNSKMTYLTNCSNSNFETSDMLSSLDSKTEVLIFRGNNLPNIPSQVLGTTDTFESLREIDFSSNNIKTIAHDAFAGAVDHVTKLVLNDNKWEMEGGPNNIFRSFKSMQELQLVGTFKNHRDTSDVLNMLNELFARAREAVRSLHVLLLDDNAFTELDNDSFLCYLTNLRRLTLTRNNITHLGLTKRCTASLQELDLRYNNLQRLDNKTMETLAYIKDIRVDMKYNKFACDCHFIPTLRWIKNTPMELVERDSYVCHTGYPSELVGEFIVELEEEQLKCPPVVTESSVDDPPESVVSGSSVDDPPESVVSESSIGDPSEENYNRSGFIILGVVLALTAGLVAGVLYVKRVEVSRCLSNTAAPIKNKFQYTTIGKREDGEVDV